MKVSIITVTYNSAKTLKNTLNSVANQTYKNIEHIIVDGASTDGTQAIAEAHRNQIAAYISEPDNGIYDAMNKGLKLATGDIIGLLNSDDVFANNQVIETVVKHFEQEHCDVIYGDMIYKSSDPSDHTIYRYWKSNNFNADSLKFGWMPPHPTLYCTRKVYNEVGNYDTRFRICSDYDFALRIFSNSNYKKRYLPMVMVQMAIGGASYNFHNVQNKMREVRAILKKNNIGSVFTVCLKSLRKLNQYLSGKKEITD